MSDQTALASRGRTELCKLYRQLVDLGLDHAARCVEMRDPSLTQDALACIPSKEGGDDDDDINSASTDTTRAMMAYLTEDGGSSRSVFRKVTCNIIEPKRLDVAWYFAYGSNMSEEQCKVRLGKTYCRELLHLKGYRLAFNKSSPQPGLAYANCVKCDEKSKGHERFDDEIYGVGYLVTVDQLLRMDHFEGCHFNQYKRERVECQIRSGVEKDSLTTAFIYFAVTTVQDCFPSAEYLSRIVEGEDILPEDYVEWIRNHPTSKLRSPRQEARLNKEL